jgi:hypothetical protein
MATGPVRIAFTNQTQRVSIRLPDLTGESYFFFGGKGQARRTARISNDAAKIVV